MTMKQRSAELERRATDRTSLLVNVKLYLDVFTLEDYLIKFGSKIVSGEFANFGVFANHPDLYTRTVKLFAFYADVMCDTPEYAHRRENAI